MLRIYLIFLSFSSSGIIIFETEQKFRRCLFCVYRRYAHFITLVSLSCINYYLVAGLLKYITLIEKYLSWQSSSIFLIILGTKQQQINYMNSIYMSSFYLFAEFFLIWPSMCSLTPYAPVLFPTEVIAQKGYNSAIKICSCWIHGG